MTSPTNTAGVKMKGEQLHVLQHTLGVDKYGEGDQYRNHFCAGGDDVRLCEELVAMGYMERYPDRQMVPYPIYGVTDEGKQAMRQESPPAPKLTRSQKRYRAFLDADLDCTFREYMQIEKLNRIHERGGTLEDYI